jgi:hypothetical protein
MMAVFCEDGWVRGMVEAVTMGWRWDLLPIPWFGNDCWIREGLFDAGDERFGIGRMGG